MGKIFEYIRFRLAALQTNRKVKRLEKNVRKYKRGMARK